jgi:gas vesicle protein
MKTRKLFVGAALGLAVYSLALALAQPALGQGRFKGRYFTKSDVERIIKRVEDRSDSFKKHVDRSLDRGRLDGTDAEDRINDQVKDFEKALDELRKEFDKQDRWIEVRSNVEKVIDEAEDVNAVFRRRNLAAGIESEWALLRADINKLAGVYDVRRLK